MTRPLMYFDFDETWDDWWLTDDQKMLKEEDLMLLRQNKQKEIQKELDKNINTTISAADIAKLFNVTSVYANRVFKAKYGQTIKQYINETALKKAAYWLKHSDFSVGEISDLLGYCNDNYFSCQFKKMYGISPKQYQLKHNLNLRCNTPDYTQIEK